jgi:hypothetical protein
VLDFGVVKRKEFGGEVEYTFSSFDPENAE